MGVVYRATTSGSTAGRGSSSCIAPTDALTDRWSARRARWRRSTIPTWSRSTTSGRRRHDLHRDGAGRGSSLRLWQQQRHTVANIVEAYIAAAALARRSRAGIVHRDFQPDNAWSAPTGASASPTSGWPRPPSETRAPPISISPRRARVGTPAYMAPEQFTGATSIRAPDQFNSAVALYEALYGAARSPANLRGARHSVCAGRVRPAPPAHGLGCAARDASCAACAPAPATVPDMDHCWRSSGAIAPGRGGGSRSQRRARAALALGLVADLVVRDAYRADHEAFVLTGGQTSAPGAA